MHSSLNVDCPLGHSGLAVGLVAKCSYCRRITSETVLSLFLLLIGFWARARINWNWPGCIKKVGM